MTPYNYVVIEGNIGAGKTSLATMIAEQFNAKLILEQFEENSFLPKFYKEPEKYAFPLELSFLAERYQQLKTQLISQDLFKSFVIADYFIDKSLIFAQKNLPDDEYTLYSKLFNIINPTLPKPDLLVYLYVNIDRLKNNIKHRGRSYEQDIKNEYLEKIQTGYFEYIKHLPEARILVIDINTLDFVNNKMDYQTLLALIFKEYPKGIHRISL
ncbi:MAG: deoxynucleoside kinase [Bacteroidales bacterium]